MSLRSPRTPASSRRPSVLRKLSSSPSGSRRTVPRRRSLPAVVDGPHFGDLHFEQLLDGLPIWVLFAFDVHFKAQRALVVFLVTPFSVTIGRRDYFVNDSFRKRLRKLLRRRFAQQTLACAPADRTRSRRGWPPALRLPDCGRRERQIAILAGTRPAADRALDIRASERRAHRLGLVIGQMRTRSTTFNLAVAQLRG